MKKLLLSGLSLVILAISTQVSAQITHESGYPASWGAFKSATDGLPIVKMASFNLKALVAEDVINDAEKSGPWRFGNPFYTNYTIQNSGVWSDLPNGERVWRFGVTSKDALSLNIIFDNYKLVPGDQVFIYNADRSDVIGPFTHLNNKDWDGLATLPISGETLIVELRQVNPSASLQSQLTIGQITHGYRDIFGYAKRKYEKGLGDSGSCNNNVICPEGDPWRCQISSVAMIVVGGSGACTGTILNNHSEDETPLFLSANHCGTNVTNWVFRFNWDSPTCTPTANGPTTQTVSGASLLANSAGSDFALMELSSPIPASYNVYYSGWDATGDIPTSNVGIHHPSGDIKKITFDNDPATATTWGGAEVWEIAQWEDGTTEPGSSGSGLWDQNQRLIGQLFGGSASCGSITNDDYGRLSVSWDGGGSAATRVRDYLDPGNTGLKTLDGLGTGSCAGITFDDDAATQSIDGLNTSYCNETTVTPTMTLKNNGNLTLTSVNIAYDFNTGTTTGTIPWTGSLAAGATASVPLTTFTLVAGANTLTVTTDSPNGNADANPSNDSKTSNFTAVMGGVMITVDIIQDEYGSETTWEINDGLGNVLGSGGPYTDGNDQTLESATVCLSQGECYNFVINDSYGDGICCGYGDGSYSVYMGATIFASGGTFADSETTNFCIPGSGAGLNQNVLAGINVYPNPTNGIVTVDLSKLEGFDAEVSILNTMGAIVAHKNVTTAMNQFDLSAEANGLYFVEVVTANGKAVYKLNISK
ncbi:MAG: lysyl endopeptidase [Crocinitomicaceae bacterium]|jgi:lysyl endopeptidase